MKNLKFLFGFMTLLASLTFMACSSGSDDEGNNVPPPDPVVPVPDNGTFTASKLTGVVTAYGFPLKGVTVTNGTETAKTDNNGVFTFDKVNVVGGRTVLKFSKEGYIDVVRSRPQVDGDQWNISMIELEDWQRVNTITFSSESPMNVTVGTMKIVMPDGYKDASTGAAYSGQVTAQVVYLSPDDDDFADAMPGGDLAAIRADNSDAQLISYGMISVNLTGKDGQKLQLADGKTAELTFPIPESLKDKKPAEIPLWTFDEETGLWKEEGVATLQGETYVGTVCHFSWANLDYPEKRATLKVTVKDSNGKTLPFIPVVLDGEVSYRTNSNGKFECYIPANTAMDAVVKQESYANLSADVKTSVPSLNGGDTYNLAITLPATSVVSGVVTNEGSGSKIVRITIFYGEYMDMSTATVISDMFGNYRIYAPVGYTGEATIVAWASDGTRVTQAVTLDGTDKTVNLTINSEAVASGTGQIAITDSKGEKTVIYLPDADDEWNGVSESAGILDVNLNTHDTFEQTMERLSFQISGYTPSKEVYEGVSVDYNREVSRGWTGYHVTATVKVVKKDGRYYFTIKNAPSTMDQQGKSTPITLDAEFNMQERTIAR
ncbi:MAG: hypothetical protein IJT97_10500 [Bacteroidaceae bacterium]|nr:hypothetical protein [Bacteroidaceae bacterium]